MKLIVITSIIALSAALACTSQAGSNNGGNATPADTVAAQNGATFDADSAFSFIEAQLAFGPRVAGTEDNTRCREWIVAKLRQFGADTVVTQSARLKAFNGDSFTAVNVFAQINKSAAKRILLLAHYDTRPWADEDPNPDNRTTPIPGANDGGSGVAVMLEVARQLSAEPAEIGVDMLFVDAEDYGDSSGSNENSWALGTQHWAKNMPYDRQNLPKFGILLDIVGGVGAKFYREYHSDLYARAINTKVWTAARACGFGQTFVNSQAGAVTDDHIHINQAGIPCIDIIECNNPSTGSFPPTWHTLADDITSIDRRSLLAVGTTVMQVIRNEK